MEGMPFLLSLRRFLQKFKLPGVSQMVDRILEAFSHAYCKANPNDFSSPSIVHGIGERALASRAVLARPAGFSA